jgi:hypothetical protein
MPSRGDRLHRRQGVEPTGDNPPLRWGEPRCRPRSSLAFTATQALSPQTRELLAKGAPDHRDETAVEQTKYLAPAGGATRPPPKPSTWHRGSRTEGAGRQRDETAVENQVPGTLPAAYLAGSRAPRRQQTKYLAPGRAPGKPSTWHRGGGRRTPADSTWAAARYMVRVVELGRQRGRPRWALHAGKLCPRDSSVVMPKPEANGSPGCEDGMRD